MKKPLLLVVTNICIFFIACTSDSPEIDAPAFTAPRVVVQYPDTYKDTSQVDNYHGQPVADPYRWLEYEFSPSVDYWLKKQRAVTREYFDQIPFHQTIRDRLTNLWNHERFSLPEKRGDYYYIFKNKGLQDQAALYRCKDPKDSMILVLNPEKGLLAENQTISTYSIAPGGDYLAYLVSDAGSDWQTIKVYDLKKEKPLKDEVQWVKFSNISWYRDGFFYSRYPRPDGYELSGVNEFQQLYYHQLGDQQEKDELFYADRRNPKRNVRAELTEDQRYLVILVSGPEAGNAVYFMDLRSGDYDFTPVYEGLEYEFELVGNNRNRLIFRTNYQADNYRLIEVKTSNPSEQFWEELIPENEDVLQRAALFGGRIVTNYLHNVSSQLHIFNDEGQERVSLPLPGKGTLTDFGGSQTETEAFYTFSSFTQPNIMYRLDLNRLRAEVYKREKTDFDGDVYETKQVWYESYDGTKIPMFLIHKKGLVLDGTNPTLLYGHGGFNKSMSPRFNVTEIRLFPVFLENNGICAVPNVRGGGEFGSDWWKAGAGSNKRQAFDDFQAAAEYLSANKYTSAHKIAIYGRGNGGLLVGNSLIQRPDLYGAAVSAYGPLDMLRFQEFSTGWTWISEYGDVNRKEDFDNLYRYSPLHHIEKEKFPATLLTTSERNGRVVPAHAYKFAAGLQAKAGAETPALIRVEENAGHSDFTPVEKLIGEGADVLSFIFYNLEENVIYQ